MEAANHYVRPGAAGNGSGNDWTNAYTALPGSTLARGDTYFYDVRVEGLRDGRPFAEQRRVVLRSGEESRVNFANRAETTASAR